MPFYETTSKTCEGQKIHYKGDTSLGTLLKFKVHQNGMKVKVEEVKFQDAKDNKITTNSKMFLRAFLSHCY